MTPLEPLTAMISDPPQNETADRLGLKPTPLDDALRELAESTAAAE
jgi:hypothetical protein